MTLSRRDFLLGATAVAATIAVPVVVEAEPSIYAHQYRFVSYARGFLVDYEEIPDESWALIGKIGEYRKRTIQHEKRQTAADMFGAAF